MNWKLVIGLCLGIAGCTKAPQAPPETDDKPELASLIEKQRGRFQMIGASPDTPAMVMDTVTGCVAVVRYDSERRVWQKEVIGYDGSEPDRMCRTLPLADVYK